MIGQCLLVLRAQLEGMKGYEKVNKSQDMIGVLKLIRALCCQHDQNNDKTYAVVSSLKKLLYLYQKPDTTINEYQKEF